jgi:TonB family protein
LPLKVVHSFLFERCLRFMSRLGPILIVFLPALAVAAVSTPAPTIRQSARAERELRTWKPLLRASQFVDVRHVSASAVACGEVQPPQALTTPSPLMTGTASGKKAKVSFIIGTDGRVHSPLILESAGATGDRTILSTVRSWKYRPATCNGVPTETEGKIEFSSR